MSLAKELSIKPIDLWWLNDPKDLMTYIYWQRNKIPPIGKDARQLAWTSIVSQLTKKHPVPTGFKIPTL